MARRQGIARVVGVATGNPKTLIQLVAAANHALGVVEVGIGFHGVNNTQEPILVELLRQTTAGTASALTPVKADDGVADTLDTTAQQTFTVEPTAGDVLRAWTVHPQTGLVWQAHDLAEVIVAAGGRVGLRVTTALTVNCDAYVCFEE